MTSNTITLRIRPCAAAKREMGTLTLIPIRRAQMSEHVPAYIYRAVYVRSGSVFHMCGESSGRPCIVQRLHFLSRSSRRVFVDMSMYLGLAVAALVVPLYTDLRIGSLIR